MAAGRLARATVMVDSSASQVSAGLRAKAGTNVRARARKRTRSGARAKSVTEPK